MYHTIHIEVFVQEWDPTLPGLAVCERSRGEVLRWAEQRAGQQILLTTPTVLVGYRAEVYRSGGGKSQLGEKSANQ
jgi:hypothetical protein